VKDDGSLGKPVSFFQHVGKGADPKRQPGPRAHSIVFSPDNQFVLAADLGIDQVLSYQLDPATSKLSPNPKQSFVETDPAAGPRHLIFHPDGKHVYTINELSNSVTLFDYNTESGTLAKQQTIPTVPEKFEGKSYCADLKITPNGKFLYGTNRGHDSIAIYQIDPKSGRLTNIGIEPSLGKGPQNLAIFGDGEWLICANMPGNSVVVFKIDPKTGGITPTEKPIEMPMPSCIMVVGEGAKALGIRQ
jgi:6-phosphogluconolactonase